MPFQSPLDTPAKPTSALLRVPLGERRIIRGLGETGKGSGMSLTGRILPGGRRGVSGRAGLALALAAAVSLAAGGGEPTLKELYDAARRAYEAEAVGPE